MKKIYKLVLALTMILSAFPLFQNVSKESQGFDTTLGLQDYDGSFALPSGYTRYECLVAKSNGALKVPTGVFGNDNLDIEVEFSYDASTWKTIFGNYFGEGYNSIRILTGATSNKLVVDYQNSTKLNRWSFLSTPLDRHKITFSNNYCIYDNNKISETGLQKGNDNLSEISLGGTFAGSIYSTKIWENKEIIRYYIPCKSSSGELGFYDLINNSFSATIGSGTLIGKEVETDPEHEALASLLPSNYLLLNDVYLTNGYLLGLDYLNNSDDFSADLKFSMNTESSSREYFNPIMDYEASTSATNNCTKLTYSSKNKWLSICLNTLSNKHLAVNNFVYDSNTTLNVKFGKKFGFVVNNVEHYSISDVEEYVSSAENKGLVSIKKMYVDFDVKIKHLVFYVGNTIVRNYIPAFQKTGHKFGLYEVIENKFLTIANGGYSASTDLDAYNVNFTCTLHESIIKSENNIMYLPSDADFSNLDISIPNGTSLYSTDLSHSTKISSNKVDLTQLFDSMESGTKYQCFVLIDGLYKLITFVKSSALSSMFLNLNGHISILNFDSVLDQKTELSGQMKLCSPDGKSIISDNVTKFKGRGNWSYSTVEAHKPYSINLESKNDLLGSGFKTKKYALLNHDGNATDIYKNGAQMGLSNALFSSLGSSVDFKYKYLDLYINGEYYGNYCLMERINLSKCNLESSDYSTEDKLSTTRIIQSSGVGTDTNKDGLADSAVFNIGGTGGIDDSALRNGNIAKNSTEQILLTTIQDLEDEAINSGIQAYQYSTNSSVNEGGYGGVVIELCRPYGKDMYEASWFITKRGQCFSLKDPEYASKDQVIKAAVFIQEFEDALFSDTGYNSKNKYYGEYLDIDSFAKDYAIGVFSGLNDFMESSTFFYADVNSVNGDIIGKMKGDISWDLQSTYNVSALNNKTGGNYGAGFYKEQFMTHGDFANVVYEITKNGSCFKKELDSWIEEKYSALLDDIEDSFAMTKDKFEHVDTYLIDPSTYYGLKAAMIEYLKNRTNLWYNTAFNPSKNLIGLTIRKENGVLYANATGNAKHSGFQWYKVNNNGSSDAVDGATSSSFTPSEEGLYFVKATGGNMMYSPSYTFSYNSPLWKNTSITMSSNVINFKNPKYSSNYDSLSVALSSMEKDDFLIVDQNYSDNDAVYVVKEGVTLDLHGCVVTNALSVVAQGQIIDTQSEKGLLDSDMYLFSDNQKYLPIYNDNYGNNLRGYSFFDVTIEEQLSAANKLQFRMSYNSEDCHSALDLIGNGIAKSRIKAQVAISYLKDDGSGKTSKVTETFTFNDEWLEYIIFGSGSEPEKTYKRVFNFTIGNLSSLKIVGPIYMQCSFVAYCGETAITSVKGTNWKTSDLGTTWVVA